MFQFYCLSVIQLFYHLSFSLSPGELLASATVVSSTGGGGGRQINGEIAADGGEEEGGLASLAHSSSLDRVMLKRLQDSRQFRRRRSNSLSCLEAG